MTAIRHYAAFARIQFRTVLVFRMDYLAGLAGVLVQIVLLHMVWSAVYKERGVVDGVPLSTMLAYATLANVHAWLMAPLRFSLIPERVREGRVGVDLLRPVGFLGQVIAGQAGRTAATAPFLVLALPPVLLLGGMSGPASGVASLVYPVSLALAYLISTLLSVLVGLISFWTLEVSGIYVIYRSVLQFMSGALIPLWFMPGLLRTVVEFMPFQAITYVPTAVYLGRIEGDRLVEALAVQAGWVAVLWVATRWTWSRAVHRVVVQGG